MSGTAEGAAKAAATNKANNPNYYAEMGTRGGKAPHKGKRGFANDRRSILEKVLGKPSRAQQAGAIGGRISRRRKVTE